MSGFPARGLYALTDSSFSDVAALASATAAAIRGGAAVIQYRDKTSDPGKRRDAAVALARLCRASNVPLIINDDPLLARDAGAHGVHVGKDDASLEAARAILGPGAIVGVSCYASAESALRAQESGATYVAFGRFFESSSKPEAAPADPQLLRDLRSRIQIPMVAIGGITPENGPRLIDAGADLLAVISGVFGQTDPEAAARTYARLFATGATESGRHAPTV